MIGYLHYSSSVFICGWFYELFFSTQPILSHILSNSTILMSFLITPFKVFIAVAAHTHGTFSPLYQSIDPNLWPMGH